MSFTADPDARQAFITGLQDLAWYLAAHPAVPVPRYGTDIHLHADSTDDGGCAQVDHFAWHLGAPPRTASRTTGTTRPPAASARSATR
jgi:hypothetical protein